MEKHHFRWRLGENLSSSVYCLIDFLCVHVISEDEKIIIRQRVRRGNGNITHGRYHVAGKGKGSGGCGSKCSVQTCKIRAPAGRVGRCVVSKEFTRGLLAVVIEPEMKISVYKPRSDGILHLDANRVFLAVH